MLRAYSEVSSDSCTCSRLQPGAEAWVPAPVGSVHAGLMAARTWHTPLVLSLRTQEDFCLANEIPRLKHCLSEHPEGLDILVPGRPLNSEEEESKKHF